MRAFTSFRGLPQQAPHIIWQEADSLFPFACNSCGRSFPQGGKRWLGSHVSSAKHTHMRAVTWCDDCHAGRDPHRRPAPKLADRRTSLD